MILIVSSFFFCGFLSYHPILPHPSPQRTFTWERAKIVVEPSGAVGVAAVFEEGFRSLAGTDGLDRVAIILTGGNIDLDRLPW